MAGDEYSIGGGKLKLKGSKVSGGRIEKKKKKSSKKKEEDSASGTPSGDATQKSAVEQNESLNRDSTPTDSRVEKRDDNDNDDGDKEREIGGGKTETERKYEEIRRKRVCFSFFFYFAFPFFS
jgi:protein FAM32A